MTCVRWSTIVAMMIGAVSPLVMAARMPASAQSDAAASKVSVRVSPVIVAEPEIETQISIVVGPDGSVPKQTFVRIKGLPQAARLSDGHVVSPGIWAVPLSALATLKLTAPLSSSGRSDLTLTLVTVDGAVLNETRSSLVVAPAWLLGSAAKAAAQTPPPAPPQPTPQASASVPAQPQAQPSSATPPAQVQVAAPAAPPPVPPRVAVPPSTTQPAPQAAVAPPPAAPPVAQPVPATVRAPVVAALPPPPPPTAVNRTPPPAPPAAVRAPAPPSPPKISAADQARAEDMIRRGDTFMNQGNVAAARQFFRRAADMGHGLGALRLGTTYDPYELAGASVVGLQPDTKEARSWYEKARDLGMADAAQRLSRLPNR